MDIVIIIGATLWRKQNVLVCESIILSPIILHLRWRLRIQKSIPHLRLLKFRLFYKVWSFHQNPLRLVDIIVLCIVVFFLCQHIYILFYMIHGIERTLFCNVWRMNIQNFWQNEREKSPHCYVLDSVETSETLRIRARIWGVYHARIKAHHKNSHDMIVGYMHIN